MLGVIDKSHIIYQILIKKEELGYPEWSPGFPACISVHKELEMYVDMGFLNYFGICLLKWGLGSPKDLTPCMNKDYSGFYASLAKDGDEHGIIITSEPFLIFFNPKPLVEPVGIDTYWNF